MGRNEMRWEVVQNKMLARVLTPRLCRVLDSDIIVPDIPVDNYYIFGATNTGKTVLAASLIGKALKQAYLNGVSTTVHFINTYDLIDEVKTTFNTTTSKEQDVIGYYMGVDVLVLDDFGLMKPTEWVYQILYRIINTRCENEKTTIYTSNHSLPAVAEVFGDDRIVSRIQRQCKVLEKKPFNS